MSEVDPLNGLFLNIGERLSQDELKTLKRLVEGKQITIRENEKIETAEELFTKLKQKEYISETKLTFLKELLERLGRRDLVKLVATFEEQHGHSTDFAQDVQHDQFINSTASTFTKSTHDDEDVILKCQEKLRKEYKRLSLILPLPWLDGADRLKLEDIYTELDLQSSDGTIVQREDIFSCSGDDENPKRILIEGEPGYGKSTFCKMIAYDWAKNKTEYLRNFKLLFLLEFKDLQAYHSENEGKESFKDSIFDLVLKDVKEREALWSFIENNQSQVCFIFDGLDEVSSSNLPLYFKQMVQQKCQLLSECHVIVTSRIIRDVNSKHMYNRKLSIKGLDRAKVESFVKKYSKCLVSMDKAGEISFAERFIRVGEILSPRNSNSLMQSPLNTLMLCEIFKQEGEVPHFITEIYEAVVEYMVKWYCENTGEDHKFNDTEMNQNLLFLGKKSHESLSPLRGQLFLSDDEVKSYPHILKLGFLSKPSTSSKGYSFFHLTFQEYFAALYIADLCSTNPSEFADIVDISLFYFPACSNTTLIFVAGLLKDKQTKMFEIWCRKIRYLQFFNPIFILQESGFVTQEIIGLCAAVLPIVLKINTADLESHHNKRSLEIIELLLQCSHIHSDIFRIKVSASNPNARKLYSTCRASLKANSKKINVELEIDCDLTKCAATHYLNDLTLATDVYTDDTVSLHIRNYGDIDVLRSIPDILDAFSKITARKHVISGLPFSLNLIDIVLLKLNDALSLYSAKIVFDEETDTYRSEIQQTRTVQITSKAGKCKICCNIDEVNFDLVALQRLLQRCTSSTGDREVLNIKLKCDFRMEAIESYVENILERMKAVDIDELTLDLLCDAKLDIKMIIVAIMKRVSSLSVQTFIINGFPGGSLELIDKVLAHLSGNKALKSIRIVCTEPIEKNKVYIHAKFGKLNISYEIPLMDFDLVSFHQLLLQYASLSNHTAVIRNVRVTCARNAICISKIHDAVRRIESVPIDNMAVEFSGYTMDDLRDVCRPLADLVQADKFSEYSMDNLTDVCNHLIGLVQTLSSVPARELTVTGLPIGNNDFIVNVHKSIVVNKSSELVKIEFKEKPLNIFQTQIEITAKVGSFESSIVVSDLNFELSRLQRLLSELSRHGTVIFDITCDFRQCDVGSYIRNLFSRFKSADIHELSLEFSWYANAEPNDVRLCISNIMNGLEGISAEQLGIIVYSDKYEQINFMTLQFQRLHNFISIKKVSITFTLFPVPQPSEGKVIKISAAFGKFMVVYHAYNLKFKLQSLHQSLSYQASLNNEKVTLYGEIYLDLNDRALDSYIGDMTVNMKAVDITHLTLSFFNFATENAHHIDNIMANIAQVKIQTLLVLGIPFSDLNVLTTVSEPFTKLIPNTACHFLSGPTCPSSCKLNLMQHSNVIAVCKTCQFKVRICKASCDLINFYQRFLQICLADESDVIVGAHISYDGNRQQADFNIQYLLLGQKALRFGLLSFLDRCNYNKLSVEGRDTMDVLKTVVAVNSKLIRYENCPSVNFEFAKSVLDIMLKSQSEIVALSFREKMNRSRILDMINSFENDGLEIHSLRLTSRHVSVVGKYVKSPMSAKEVQLVFATGHPFISDLPRDDTGADVSQFHEQDDLPVGLLKQCGIESDGRTIGQKQTRAITLSSLNQYVSALASLTAVSVLDSEVSPEENVERHLSEILTKESLKHICFMGYNLNEIIMFVIDCIKKTDKVRKNYLKIGICHALDSKNIDTLRDALETYGFVHEPHTNTSPSVENGTRWRGKRVEIILMPCEKDYANHDIEYYPFFKSELRWCALNNMQGK